MLEHYFGIIEAIFIFSLAIAFYVWQMSDLKKAKLEAEARERNAQQHETDEPKTD
ncbi:MAG: hypothetical protein ACK40W_03875 [Allorhizobium sp.]